MLAPIAQATIPMFTFLPREPPVLLFFLVLFKTVIFCLCLLSLSELEEEEADEEEEEEEEQEDEASTG